MGKQKIPKEDPILNKRGTQKGTLYWWMNREPKGRAITLKIRLNIWPYIQAPCEEKGEEECYCFSAQIRKQEGCLEIRIINADSSIMVKVTSSFLLPPSSRRRLDMSNLLEIEEAQDKTAWWPLTFPSLWLTISKKFKIWSKKRFGGQNSNSTCIPDLYLWRHLQDQ